VSPGVGNHALNTCEHTQTGSATPGHRLSLVGITALLALGLLVGLSVHPATLLLTGAARAIVTEAHRQTADTSERGPRVAQGERSGLTQRRCAGATPLGMSLQGMPGAHDAIGSIARVRVALLNLPPPSLA